MKRRFLRELKRRRVLHTAWLYVLGGWVVLQVAEVLAGAGLPPVAVRHLLVGLTIGFLPVLILGWFFDISREGIRRTAPLQSGQDPPDFGFADHVLLAGLLLVVAADAWVLSLAPPISADGPAEPATRTLAVLGFDDRDLAPTRDPLGDAFAAELRESLTRIAGLRVLGPETSRVLKGSAEAVMSLAEELRVTGLVRGAVSVDSGLLEIDVRLIGVPAGEPLWSRQLRAPMADAVSLQHTLAEELMAVVGPDLDAVPVHGQRSGEGQCDRAYDLYLRGRQLVSNTSPVLEGYERGQQLLREAVAVDERCAVAWEALAVSHVNWEMSGFAEAGAAARRALELNDKLPMAWAVLAEIAEQEMRWDESEEYFLRALYADPTNAHVNHYYAEALMARGRVRKALRHVLAAYRYEPASRNINYEVATVALHAGQSDLAITHARIVGDLSQNYINDGWDVLAQAALQKGQVDGAIEILRERESILPDWLPDCLEAQRDPGSGSGLLERVLSTLEAIESRQYEGSYLWGWAFSLRCLTWLGEAERVYDEMLGDEVPTEFAFIVLSHPDSAGLRQHPRFRKLVVESGLDEYWRRWGWPDYCRPEGVSFVCD